MDHHQKAKTNVLSNFILKGHNNTVYVSQHINYILIISIVCFIIYLYFNNYYGSLDDMEFIKNM